MTNHESSLIATFSPLKVAIAFFCFGSKKKMKILKKKVVELVEKIIITSHNLKCPLTKQWFSMIKALFISYQDKGCKVVLVIHVIVIPVVLVIHMLVILILLYLFYLYQLYYIYICSSCTSYTYFGRTSCIRFNCTSCISNTMCSSLLWISYSEYEIPFQMLQNRLGMMMDWSIKD